MGPFIKTLNQYVSPAEFLEPRLGDRGARRYMRRLAVMLLLFQSTRPRGARRPDCKSLTGQAANCDYREVSPHNGWRPVPHLALGCNSLERCVFCESRTFEENHERLWFALLNNERTLGIV